MKKRPFYLSFMLSVILCLPMSLAVVYADAEKTKPVEWLFVVTSKEADIKQNDQGQYVLSLDHAKIEKVLAFSDRPNRIVKFISPEDFKKLWGQGKNSFEKDPPNAIAVFGQEKIAMKLMRVTVDKDKTAFVVSSDDDKMRIASMGDVSLFIDLMNCNTVHEEQNRRTITACNGPTGAEPQPDDVPG